MLTPMALIKTVLQRCCTPRRFLWRLPVGAPGMALTFDDGPDPVYTPLLLDLLAAHGVKATFFVIGEKAAQHPQLIRRMADEGHAVGGHTWSHREIVGVTSAELADDLGRCRALLAAAGGVDSNLFRPPRGKVDAASVRRVLALGYCLVHWSRTYSDYQRDGVAPLLARFRAAPPQARDIVLLHDHNQYTIDALATLLPQWRAAALPCVLLDGRRPVASAPVSVQAAA
jgi:peptidoglycan/xylan/chitin deacetylase (PgdA/CDA1 family)